MMILSTALLAVPGEYWPWYAVAATFSIPPIIVGPSRHRFWGMAGLVFSAYLIQSDIQTGKAFKERRRQMLEHFEQTQHRPNSP